MSRGVIDAPGFYSIDPLWSGRKKPDQTAIQGAAAGLGARPMGPIEMFEQGIIDEVIHGLPRSTISGPGLEEAADERKVQDELDHVRDRFSQEWQEAKRLKLSNNAWEADWRRRFLVAIRAIEHWHRVGRGADDPEQASPDEKPNAVGDMVRQVAMKLGYRIERMPDGLYQLIRHATREKIEAPTSLHYIGQYLLAKHKERT